MKIARKICILIGLNILLWIYSERVYGIESSYLALVQSWMRGFSKLDAACIHWIAMRIYVWLYILWNILWLEKSFALYLFIREHNFKRMFIKQYIRCFYETILYFAIQVIVFAALFYMHSGEGRSIVNAFGNIEIWQIVFEECITALNFSLLVYFLYCYSKKVEVGFILVLLLKILISFVFKNRVEWGVLLALILNAGLTFITMTYSSVKFYERVQGEK